MPTNVDLSSLPTVLQVAIPFVLGIAAKWAHGNWITKINQFRNVVDDVDDIVNKQSATPEQQSKAVTDIKALISQAQGL